MPCQKALMLVPGVSWGRWAVTLWRSQDSGWFQYLPLWEKLGSMFLTQ